MESGWGGAVTGSGCRTADSTGIAVDSPPPCAGRSEMDRGEEEKKGGHQVEVTVLGVGADLAPFSFTTFDIFFGSVLF